LISILTIVILSYVVGSLPTGYIFAKFFRKVDIRTIGSGSTGATNTMRLLGPKIAAIVLLIDALKGLFATMLIGRINLGDLAMPSAWLMMIAGMSAIAGHIFPVWIGFKGGKGIGTAAGMLIGMLPLETAFALAVFVVTVATTKYISLGSILASLYIFVALLAERMIFGKFIEPAQILLGIVLSIIVLMTHRQNIKRLLKGTENRFVIKKN